MQTPNTGHLPTLKEELDRKAMESAMWLFESVAAGRITAAQFSTGLDALFMAVSGLTNDDVFKMISAGSDVAATADLVQRRRFLKGVAVVQLAWKPGDSFITLRSWLAGTEKPNRVSEFGSPAVAFAQFNKLADHTLATGYAEI